MTIPLSTDCRVLVGSCLSRLSISSSVVVLWIRSLVLAHILVASSRLTQVMTSRSFCLSLLMPWVNLACGRKLGSAWSDRRQCWESSGKFPWFSSGFWLRRRANFHSAIGRKCRLLGQLKDPVFRYVVDDRFIWFDIDNMQLSDPCLRQRWWERHYQTPKLVFI